MKIIRTTFTLFSFLILNCNVVKAQPIPIEWIMGDKYGTVNLVFNKSFSQNSRFGFFHMNTVQFYYKDDVKNSFLLQDLIYVEAVKNLRVAGGVVYSKAGFNTTAGIQYIYSGNGLMVLCAPRVNIESNPSYDIMTILQYKPKISDHVKLFTRKEIF
jgi:hypothetical protein